MSRRRGQPYSQDMPHRVVASGDKPIRSVAERLSVSPSCVWKVRSKFRCSSDATAGPQHNHIRPRLEPIYDALRERVATEADATVAELRAWAAREYGIVVSHPVMWEALNLLGLTLKKSACAPPSRTAPTSPKRASPWTALQAVLDAARLVFLDETWATTNMTRTHGRAPRGERLTAAVPHGHWHTTTFLSGLRHDGLIAPLVFNGAINGTAFLAYVEQMLAPALRVGDIVICDNLASQKVAGVRETIEARGASLLYLPPYSPDLNPIELAFSKLKRLL